MKQLIARLIAEYPLPKLDDIRFVPDAESYEQKREEFIALVKDSSLESIVGLEALERLDRTNRISLADLAPRDPSAALLSPAHRDP